MLKLICDCGRDGEVAHSATGYFFCTGCHRKYTFCDLRCGFVSQYPHLVTTLKVMFYDNDFDQKPEYDWLWPANVACLEEMASKLTSSEKLIVSAGECEEMVELVERHKIWPLNSFLNQVFDGDLTKDFCGT